MSLRYFKAGESEMSWLGKIDESCNLCQRVAKCFDLKHALNPESLLPATRGCMTCLHDRRFGFFHVTDAGYLDETGLTWYDDPPMSPSRVFVASADGLQERLLTPHPEVPTQPSSDAIDELRATPALSTWNEVSWPVHCHDFMVFLGPWQPRDIAYAARELGLTAQQLFEGMVDHYHRRAWQGVEGDEWSLHFMVFRCSACNDYRGIIDLD